MASLLKILTDTSCDVYVDYEYRGHAEPYKLLRLELRKGCYILEFKYKDLILESQDYIMPSNEEETLLKLSLADKYAAAQELKRTLFYIATEKFDADRLCPESNIATHYYNEADGTGSITFYESITEIRRFSFVGCISLKSITIPESVISIGEHAFSECSSLTNVMISDSVTKIGDRAFYGCSSLTSITIPESVTSIGEGVFSGCNSLSSFYGKYASKDNGCLIVDKILVASAPVNLTSYTIPEGVTSIGNCAFSGCSSLTSITIPESVTSIGEGVFSGCNSLSSFYGKYTSKDNKCLIVDNALVAFAPANLTSYTIPEGVTSIGNWAFYGCTSLTNLTIPDSVTEIGDEVFFDCSSLTGIIIPEGVTSIGNWAFYDCTSLTNLTIPDSVTEIGEFAFSGCSSLTSITIPEGVTSIGNWAFCGCTSLTNLTIPDSVIEIGLHAFNECSSLTSIIVSEGNIVYDSRDNCNAIIKTSTNRLIFGCQSSIIPNSVTEIGYSAFQGCTSLKSVIIPEGVTKVDGSAFDGCTSLTSITIPEGVTSIGNCAFSGCSSLTNVTIPDSVTEIGDDVFSGCSSLTSITIPKGVTSIGEFAFSGCTSLKSIAIPNSVTEIGYSAFQGCTSLKSVIIPEGVTKVDGSAFVGCTSLISITIPESVTLIEFEAFAGCTSLKSITIPNSVTKIGEAAFYGCISLKSVTIPESVTEIGAWALYVGATIQEGFGSANSAFERCNVNYVRYTRDYEVRGKYLFFDTETTGLPINYNAPTSDLSNWPRMVQLSWILTDNEGMTISYGNFIVKPSGFTISGPAIKLHGITNEIANKDGVALKEVLAKFMEDVKNSSCLVGHNVEFDKHIVGAELLRIGDEDIISSMTSICTMMNSINYCKIINHYGYKYPKLRELYKKLFDEEFEDAHDASADVQATKRCFFELKRRNIINDNF